MNIILTGLNGYGGNFIPELIAERSKGHGLIAVVSQHPKNSVHYPILVHLGVRFYSSLEDCLANEQVDLAILTTPMHLHAHEVTLALEKGVSVYCEKPLAPTTMLCRKLQLLAEKKNCILAVGFQWSFSNGILDLKKDLLLGRYGKILSAKSLVLWNRPRSYFTNSPWKGRLKDENNNTLNECLLSNAASHYLHNLLFLLGPSLDTSAQAHHIEADCYRAHRIETFDTIGLRVITEAHQSILFLATLAAANNQLPCFEIHCEKAVIRFPQGANHEIIAYPENAEAVHYHNPDQDRYTHYRNILDGLSKNNTTLIPCNAKTATPIMQIVDHVFLDLKVTTIPETFLKQGPDPDDLSVQDIERMMTDCYEKDKILSEHQTPWSSKSGIKLSDAVSPS